MERRLPLWAIVASTAVLTFFLGLGQAHLFDEDEPKNAECGREMFVRGDWIVPTFNEELRTDKPILVYWLMLTSFHLFGVSEFAARFWSAGLGVGTCLLTYHIGRLLFSARVGMWAGIALASTMMFTVVARASTPDSTLIFFTTLSLFLFVRFSSLGTASENDSPVSRWQDILPRSTFAYLAIYSAMAIAVLAKGPVGVLLPCVVIGFLLYSLSVRQNATAEAIPQSRIQSGIAVAKSWIQPREFFRITWAMRPYWIVLCVLVIALPWYVAVGVKTDGAWLEGFLGQHNVGRFMKPMEGHHGPIVYYPIAILIGFFPWSVFTLPIILGVAHRMRVADRDQLGLRFVACWFTVYLVFFTCARTKLPNYILPCYPAIAVIVGYWFERATIDGFFTNVMRDVRWAAWALILVGVLMIAGLGVATHLLLPGEELLAAVGVIPLIGGVVIWRMNNPLNWLATRRVFLAITLTFVITLFCVVAPRISRHQDGAFLAGEIERLQDKPAAVATYNIFPVGLVFYAERQIDRCRVPADLAGVLAEPGGLVITRADRLEELRPNLPADTVVLARKQRFLRRHDIVVLGRKSQAVSTVAEAPSASQTR